MEHERGLAKGRCCCAPSVHEGGGGEGQLFDARAHRLSAEL